MKRSGHRGCCWCDMARTVGFEQSVQQWFRGLTGKCELFQQFHWLWNLSIIVVLILVMKTSGHKGCCWWDMLRTVGFEQSVRQWFRGLTGYVETIWAVSTVRLTMEFVYHRCFNISMKKSGHKGCCWWKCQELWVFELSVRQWFRGLTRYRETIWAVSTVCLTMEFVDHCCFRWWRNVVIRVVGAICQELRFWAVCQEKFATSYAKIWMLTSNLQRSRET